MLTQLVRFASVEDVEISDASMDVRGTFPSELRYGLGGDDADSAMEQLLMIIDVESPAPREDVLRVLRRAEANCHTSQSLRKPVPVTMELRLNGNRTDLSS